MHSSATASAPASLRSFAVRNGTPQSCASLARRIDALGATPYLWIGTLSGALSLGMECFSVRIITRSPEETEHIGFRLGSFLESSARIKTVMLYGELGAGKTTLIKGIAYAFGLPKRDVCSASFVMVAEYETSPPFYHIDLYRLETPEAVDAAGIWEYIDTGGIAVIEWAERLADMPDNAIKVHITQLSDQEREIIIDGVDSEALGI